ncbi:hypothetical protein [Synechococcus sp. MIT S9503]|uniref:hypothetical protein n=1 Tax=Synechococcus sp. MIT S9503 TaxID=3082547 RepID=UPI0039A707F3|tara:strand:+ start:636 stop:827 length:192 start_codon:yes stop_codon:yes gene_type:complete
MRNTETQAGGISELSGASPNQTGDHEQTWDAVETYFECITTCSLDDGECITRCVEQLKDSDDS